MCRSTIALPRTRPRRIIAQVESRFSTTFVAVPAFSRVEPVMISGPTGRSISASHGCAARARAGLHVSSSVRAPVSRARASAPSTNGVRPLAAIPHSTSPARTPRYSTACAPAAG